MERTLENDRITTKRKNIISDDAEIAFKKDKFVKIVRSNYGDSKEDSQEYMKCNFDASAHVCKEQQQSLPSLGWSSFHLATYTSTENVEIILQTKESGGKGNDEETVKDPPSSDTQSSQNSNIPATTSTLTESQLKPDESSEECVVPSVHIPSNLHMIRLRSYVDEPRLCHKCTQPIIFNHELLTNLIEAKTLFRINRKTGLRDFNVTLFCRICDRSFLRHNSAEEHVIHHCVANDIWYCLDCQKNIINFGMASYPLPKHKDQVLEDFAINGILMTAETCELRGVSIRQRPLAPLCNKCGHILGYIGPVLHKLLDANSAIYRLESSRYRTIHLYMCRLCPKITQKKRAMEYHVLHHVKNGHVLCRICKQEERQTESGKS